MMDGLLARLGSFKKSKRVKKPNKSSTTTLKWPHPLNFTANPSTLADAGFYFDPSYDDPDNVTCFNCEKQLAGWEEGDDPFLIHWNKCAQTCSWAAVQCGVKVDMDRSGRFVFPDKTRLPNHKNMEKARLETFALGKGWAHDKTRNHGANSKSMARAGFAYTPHEAGDDLATCPYCNVSLSGWEVDDDPMEEHRKRASKLDDNCPFFEHTESRQTKSSSTKPPSKSTSKPPSRSTSRTKYHDVVVPTKTFDGDEESDAQESTTRGLGAKTPAKSRSRSLKSSAKTPRSKSRSVSRPDLKDVANSEFEDDEERIEAPPTVKKKTRSTSKSVPKSTQSDVDDQAEKTPGEVKTNARGSKSVARSQTLLQSDFEDGVANTARKTTRSRAKSKAPVEVEDEEEEEPIKKSSRSKTQVRDDYVPRPLSPPRQHPTTNGVFPGDEESDTQKSTTRGLGAKTLAKSRSRSRKSSAKTPKSRSTSRPDLKDVAKELEDEEEAMEAPPTVKKKTRSTSKSVPKSTQSDIDHEAEKTPAEVKTNARGSKLVATSQTLLQSDFADGVANTARKTTRSRAKSKAPVEVEDEEEEEPVKKSSRSKTQVKDDDYETQQLSPPRQQPTTNGVLPGDEESDTQKSTTRGLGAKTPAKSRSRSRKSSAKISKSRSTSRPDLKGVTKELEDDEEPIEAPPTVKKKTRSAAKSKAPIVVEDDEERVVQESDTESVAQSAPSTKPTTSDERDILMHDAEPETQETVMDTDQELYTAPSTPPKLISLNENPIHASRSDIPQSIPRTSGDKPAEGAQPDITPNTTLTTGPPYLPPLSRLPFMPLQTLSEAELDMTVEEWIRYQIEVEQDRFKRDGERELERFNMRAEEVRRAIESL